MLGKDGAVLPDGGTGKPGKASKGNGGRFGRGLGRIGGLGLAAATAYGAYEIMKERFSIITVKGQSGGSESWNGTTNAQAKGTATDSRVPRYRPLTLVAEQEEYGSATTRARHEVAIRYGKGHKVQATVNGWFAGAELWKPNTQVDLLGDKGKVLSTQLIVGVSYKLSDNDGWISELTLSPKEAYDLIPEAPKGKKGKGKDGGTWADMGVK